VYVRRSGGRAGIEPQRSRGLEGVQVWRSGRRAGLEVWKSWRSGGRGGPEIVEVWRSWRSGGHAGMEPQRSGDLEVQSESESESFITLTSPFYRDIWRYSRLHNRLPVFCVQHNFVPTCPCSAWHRLYLIHLSSDQGGLAWTQSQNPLTKRVIHPICLRNEGLYEKSFYHPKSLRNNSREIHMLSRPILPP
jgi:hypothetical protein